MTKSCTQYSAVVPVYNELDSLNQLLDELRRELGKLEEPYEMIFVDDGSSDGSSEVLDRFANEYPEVRVVHFGRNSGKSAAYTAGFEASKGRILLTLDADLQDDPREIPRMLKALSRNRDLVIGWKRNRMQNELLKKIPSFLYNRLKGLLFGLRLHDSNCGFRAMKREVAMNLRLKGDRYRFIPELSHLEGFRVCEIPVNHRARLHGTSKYGPGRFVSGLLDLLTVRFLSGYGTKPLHFFGWLGFLCFGIGSLLEFYVLIRKLGGSLFQTHVGAMIMGVFFLVVGVQFLAIGLLAEMISDAGESHPVHRERAKGERRGR